MKIGELARESGMSVSTIKYYLSEGLIPRPDKTKPNIAFYDTSYLKRLQIIKAMREEGLSIKSIKTILDKYPFKGISEWEQFKRNAKEKDSGVLEHEERLATVSGGEQRRFEILDAAFKVFSEKSYHNATVDEIAREAGASKGACYQYFSGKEEMFIAVLNNTMDNLLKETSEAAAGEKDPLARLGFKGMAFISKFKEVQSMLYGIYSEILVGNEILKKTGADLLEKVAVFLSADIKEGIDQGIFKPLDPMVISYSLIGIAEMAGNLYQMNEDFDVPRFFLNLMEFIRRGLVA